MDKFPSTFQAIQIMSKHPVQCPTPVANVPQFHIPLKSSIVRSSYPFLPAAKVRTMETLSLECLCCFNSKLYALFLQTPSFKSKKPEAQTWKHQKRCSSRSLPRSCSRLPAQSWAAPRRNHPTPSFLFYRANTHQVNLTFIQFVYST